MMTLGNMRENNVCSLAITCGALHCHHDAIIDLSAFADAREWPAGLRRNRCGCSPEHRPVCSGSHGTSRTRVDHLANAQTGAQVPTKAMKGKEASNDK
jgi:hypothetical protein